MACTSVTSDRVPSDEGVAAYQDGNYKTAWALLKPLADKGHFRAQRYIAFMLLERRFPEMCREVPCEEQGIALLLDAARRGDNNALIVLEGIRVEGKAYAPGDADIIAVEQERAGRGDAIMAWRLADRYLKGEAGDETDYVRWLKTVANARQNHPRSEDAAFRLCELYAAREREITALGWCRRAAQQGHAGAVILLSRLENR